MGTYSPAARRTLFAHDSLGSTRWHKAPYFSRQAIFSTRVARQRRRMNNHPRQGESLPSSLSAFNTRVLRPIPPLFPFKHRARVQQLKKIPAPRVLLLSTILSFFLSFHVSSCQAAHVFTHILHPHPANNKDNHHMRAGIVRSAQSFPLLAHHRAPYGCLCYWLWLCARGPRNSINKRM